jgi:hypothetical protein
MERASKESVIAAECFVIGLARGEKRALEIFRKPTDLQPPETGSKAAADLSGNVRTADEDALRCAYLKSCSTSLASMSSSHVSYNI